jgi:glutamate--cysteine ligase
VLAKMRTEKFGVSMEPGGQLELDTAPAPNLATLEVVFREVTALIEQRLAGTGYELVALGHAPVTPVAELGLLPKPRYRIMDREMIQRGRLTRHMMRATAGLQMTCDFADRADAGRRLALLNRLSPVLMALTANSRMVEGRDSGDASYRHRIWWETDDSRVGVPEGTLDAETAVDGYVRFARRAIALFVHDRQGEVVGVGEPVPFEDLVAARGDLTEADLDLHLSSLFPFVRLRNYLEIRCFDAVEWPLARSVLALLSGIVYCDNATAAAEAISDPLAIHDRDALRAFHLEAAHRGLDTVVPGGGGPGFRDIALQLVEFASGTLGGRDCDWAKVADLELVRQRIEER